MIDKYKVNNEQMFIEKTIVLEAWKKVQAQKEHIATMVAKACKTIRKMHIPKEASVDAKIRKLAAGVHEKKQSGQGSV